jgi:hypothetical protein
MLIMDLNKGRKYPGNVGELIAALDWAVTNDNWGVSKRILITKV